MLSVMCVPSRTNCGVPTLSEETWISLKYDWTPSFLQSCTISWQFVLPVAQGFQLHFGLLATRSIGVSIAQHGLTVWTRLQPAQSLAGRLVSPHGPGAGESSGGESRSRCWTSRAWTPRSLPASRAVAASSLEQRIQPAPARKTRSPPPASAALERLAFLKGTDCSPPRARRSRSRRGPSAMVPRRVRR